MSAIISLHDITFIYAGAAQPALAGLTFGVPAGQLCGVVGRAGAGKSTLCALCAGFMPGFFAGRVGGSALVDGHDVLRQPVSLLVRSVGLVGSNARSQISGACFSVFEEVAFGLANLGLPRAELLERVEWALAALQLDDLRDRSPYALSGGQQQRMVLAAALAMRPAVLVLDEPTAQLDPPAAGELVPLLQGLCRAGVTVLVAEHRLEWLAECAERVVALEAGRVIADGAPQAVLTDARLRENGTGWPRPARLAAQLRGQGRWPHTGPLPVTAAALLQGLGEAPPRPAQDTGAAAGVATLVETRPIVEVASVSFQYPAGVAALQEVGLRVGAGERVALLGRNGAGKSTLVRHLNGLLRPSRGVVMVAGTATDRASVAWCARHVGVVFQDIRNQLFARSVAEEVRFGPRSLGLPKALVEARASAALAALGLADMAAAHPYDLTPAQRRLVAVAAVLALDSGLLVLDEPTVGLDAASIARLLGLIAALADQGKSVLLVSHDLDLCYEACRRVVLLRDGQVALDAAWHDLDAADLALLEREVGLPLALRVGL